jgi:hypothetical protein
MAGLIGTGVLEGHGLLAPTFLARLVFNNEEDILPMPNTFGGGSAKSEIEVRSMLKKIFLVDDKTLHPQRLPKDMTQMLISLNFSNFGFGAQFVPDFSILFQAGRKNGASGTWYSLEIMAEKKLLCDAYTLPCYASSLDV